MIAKCKIISSIFHLVKDIQFTNLIDDWNWIVVRCLLIARLFQSPSLSERCTVRQIDML